MPRADLLVSLVKAGSQGDQQLLRTTVEAMAAEERAKHHHQLANKLVANLKGQPAGSRSAEVVRSFDGGHGGLYEVDPRKTLDALILGDEVLTACRELVEEQQRTDLLRSYGVEPEHRVLLSGPPGNGKTSLAEALAAELIVPLFVVRYEAVIGSFLGETSSRLKRLFDFVRTHQCVLFFDEFDTLGKERGDTHETGEIKRVVSSLLLQIDSLPSHVVVVTATNHAGAVGPRSVATIPTAACADSANLRAKGALVQQASAATGSSAWDVRQDTRDEIACHEFFRLGAVLRGRSASLCACHACSRSQAHRRRPAEAVAVKVYRRTITTMAVTRDANRLPTFSSFRTYRI